MSTEPIRIRFAVRVPPDQAFDVWTRQCARWWPRVHTISGDPESIRFEPRAGGRIFELARDGRAHEWGEILAWEPPHRLRYRWHLFFDPAQATEVDLTFTACDGGTAVALEQRGWEQLGPLGPARRAKTEQSWSTLTELYTQAC